MTNNKYIYAVGYINGQQDAMVDDLSEILQFKFEDNIGIGAKDRFYRRTLLHHALLLAKNGRLDSLKSDELFEKIAVLSGTSVDFLYDMTKYIYDNFGSI